LQGSQAVVKRGVFRLFFLIGGGDSVSSLDPSLDLAVEAIAVLAVLFALCIEMIKLEGCFAALRWAAISLQFDDEVKDQLSFGMIACLNSSTVPECMYVVIV